MALGSVNVGGSASGASSYDALENRPQINGHTLTGDQSGAELGLVEAESGKGLSSNDYSNADREKLGGVAEHATANAPSDDAPQMDGTASAGSSAAYARGDHVHPTDTSRAAAEHTHDAGDIDAGTLAADRLPTVPISKGGTGATTAEDALRALGAASFTRRTVTLTAAGWSNGRQTVTVSGILSDETAQLILPTPADASMAAYYEAMVYCSGRAQDQLTFTCDTAPTSTLTVYVAFCDVSSGGGV